MDQRDKSQTILQFIYNIFHRKGWMYLILIGILFLFYYLLINATTLFSIILISIPFALIITATILIYANNIIYFIYIFQFLTVILGSYVDTEIGTVNFTFSAVCLTLLIIYNSYKSLQWRQSYNSMMIIYVIWSFFCILQIANPNNVQEAWNIAIMHYAFYPLLFSILIPLAIKKTEHIQWLLFIWAIFILLGSMKGYWQKSHGFNQRELYLLYELGKAKTHIIWSGIRYFSFFSDAANYGVHMAMGASTFSIALFYTKHPLLKLFYVITTIAAFYGMALSGTRAAMAIPFGALIVYIVLSKSKIGILTGLIVFITAFAFFRLSYIGNGNEYIRKMRSAFYANQDASYLARMANREKMKVLMANKPFGYGLGLGGKAERFNPKELMPYPPDSWLVNVWTDTGIIGLSLYLTLHLILFIVCAWIIWTRIKNKKLRGLLTAWISTNAGYFLAAYGNDVMLYPNLHIFYTGFALCFAGVHIDKRITEKEDSQKLKYKVI